MTKAGTAAREGPGQAGVLGAGRAVPERGSRRRSGAVGLAGAGGHPERKPVTPTHQLGWRPALPELPFQENMEIQFLREIT